MSRYYEQLQNNSNENSSRRLSRRQEVTELDLFAFAAARKAREQKATASEAQPEPQPEEPPVAVAPVPEPQPVSPPPPPPPPQPVEPPRKMVHAYKEPEPEPQPEPEEYREEESEPRESPRLPVSPRRFAEIVFVGLSIIIVILALQKLLRREPSSTEEPDEDIAAAVSDESIPEPQVVVAEPAPVVPAPVIPAATPAPAAEPQPVLSVPGTAVNMDDDILTIRFTSGIFVKNDELSPEAKRTLTLLCRDIKPLLTDHSMKVSGYTDNETVKRNKLYKDNIELGMMRARAVEKFIRSQLGLPPGRINVASTGSKGAPYPNDTPDNRKRNRTVVISLIPQAPAP